MIPACPLELGTTNPRSPKRKQVACSCLGSGLIEPECDESGQVNGGEEVSGESVIERGNSPEILEPAETAFDDIPPLCRRPCRSDAA